MTSNLNTIMSRLLIAVTSCIAVIILYVVYNQLKTKELMLLDCRNGTCFSLTRGLNLARGLALNLTRNVRASTSHEEETLIEDEAAKLCRLPDPLDDKSEFYNVLAAMRVLIPRNFNSKFKNPCWYSSFSIPMLKGKIRKFYNESISLHDLMDFNEKKNLHCLPYFYIAGFPRSGTTAVYGLISHHPQFTKPAYKEIHWLTHSEFDPIFPNNLKSVMRYIYHFHHATTEMEENANLVTCDASASTIWDVFFHSPNQIAGCETPLLLSYVLPDAKYVVVLRNPWERLYSEFWYHCGTDYRVKEVIRNGPRMFHQLVEKSLDLFIACKSQHSALQCLHLWEMGIEKGRCNSVKLHTSLYYLHIIKWFSVIPRKQFFFIKSEQLFHDPREMLTELSKFLDLSPISNQTILENLLQKFKESSNQNVHKEYHDQSTALLDETKLLLNKFFQPYNRKLANLLQDNRFLWDDV